MLKYNYEEKIFIIPNTLIDNYLIDDDQQANEFLWMVNWRTLNSEIPDEFNWKNTDTLKKSVFKVLNSLITFWKTQKATFNPDLSEILYGESSDLKNYTIIKNFFFIQIFEGLNDLNEEITDFLINCSDYQNSIINDLLSLKNNEAENTLL